MAIIEDNSFLLALGLSDSNSTPEVATSMDGLGLKCWAPLATNFAWSTTLMAIQATA